jgi:hypothetical protein
VQLTVVVPIAKLEPLGGEHAIVTGASPPVNVGKGNVTATGLLSSACTIGGVGQLMAGGDVDGRVGLPQPT